MLHPHITGWSRPKRGALEMGGRREVQGLGESASPSLQLLHSMGRQPWSASRPRTSLLLLGSDTFFSLFNKRKILISIDTTLG